MTNLIRLYPASWADLRPLRKEYARMVIYYVRDYESGDFREYCGWPLEFYLL